MDQYTQCDAGFDPGSTYHAELFQAFRENHSGRLHYAVVCRALLGCTLHTRDGRKSLDGGRLFATDDCRELVNVPPSVDFAQPVPHHCLVRPPHPPLTPPRPSIASLVVA